VARVKEAYLRRPYARENMNQHADQVGPSPTRSRSQPTQWVSEEIRMIGNRWHSDELGSGGGSTSCAGYFLA
jgi:hypothetical protein